MEGILSTGNVTVKSGIHLKKNCVLKSEIQLKFYRDGLFKKSQIKSETVMSWSSRKKKEGIFCTANLVSRDFFNIFVLSQCIVYWIHFQNRHTFIYKKILLHTPFCLFLKLSNAFSVSLILNKTLEVCSMKELMLIKQANQKSLIFASNGIF